MVSLPSPIIPVHCMASMNADAVRFPKGVFPPDADFSKGGHVPLTHPHGSGGVQRGRTVGSAPLVHSFEFDYAFGIIKLFFLCCITEKYTSISSEFATAAARQG